MMQNAFAFGVPSFSLSISLTSLTLYVRVTVRILIVMRRKKLSQGCAIATISKAKAAELRDVTWPLYGNLTLQ